MDQLPPWAVAAISLVVPGLAFLGFWLKIGDRLSIAETTARAASILSAALQVKIDTQQDALASFKVEAAKEYATNKEVFHAEERFHNLVEEIKRDIRGMTDRLDRVLEGRTQ